MKDFLDPLRILTSHGVNFIVVGGVAAVANGVPINTWDLDVVYSTDPQNVERLIPVLSEWDARFRHRPELRPNTSHLSSSGHKLLMTRFGPIDFLGSIGAGQHYTDLLPHSAELELEPGLHVHVLNLETVIATKEFANGEKDRAVLPVLRATLAEIRRRQGDSS